MLRNDVSPQVHTAFFEMHDMLRIEEIGSITNTALTNIEITVAIAAPWMPKPNPKMKIGSRITFSTTPISDPYTSIFAGIPKRASCR